MNIRSVLCVICFVAISASVKADLPALPDTLMCTPGELVFAENFDPETVSERWGFKADFALRDGALLRTHVDPAEVKRVFLRDASFYNTIIQFDFRFSGETTDLRLVTGSGGGYNSVTQIRLDHFEINTPVDRDAGFVPAHLGECMRESRFGQWQTMTVEYWGDEVVASLDQNRLVIGKHPILDRTRSYFAFQFDLPGGSVDNVRIWKATGQRKSWPEIRNTLTAAQTGRDSVQRNPVERYKIERTNVKSRLTLNDQTYRDLVTKFAKLQAALHADYADAFVSHKQIGKLIAKRKQQIKATSPEFKSLENAVHKASRAEDAYVLSMKPELARLKTNGSPKQLFTSELGQVRVTLEAAADKRLAALVAETAACQTTLEERFPDVFESVDIAVESRNEERKALNRDPEFQLRNRAVVDAGKAVKEFEQQAAPSLVSLEAASRSYLDSQR